MPMQNNSDMIANDNDICKPVYITVQYTSSHDISRRTVGMVWSIYRTGDETLEIIALRRQPRDLSVLQ